MNGFDFKTAKYNVSGVSGFTLSTALRFWRTKFETIKHFRRAVITHALLNDLGDFMEEMWNNIEPLTVTEAFQEKNIETRRVMFDCIGVIRMFKELKPELLDKQVIQKSRQRWNEKNEPWTHEFEDIYELYRISSDQMFEGIEGDGRGNRRDRTNYVYAVRCWCTTTNREYWIYVPQFAAVGLNDWGSGTYNPDAINAIAWTIRLDISNPKRIFRQGDIIVAEESPESEQVDAYHLSKEDYLRLVTSET